MSAVIDSNIFLRVAFEEAGWEHCGRLLDSIFSGEKEAFISSIQLSELYTPFERANDKSAKEKLASEIRKMGIRIRDVDEEIAVLSAQIRATEKTSEGKWLALADSVILATSLILNVETFYTLDMDFSLVKRDISITAPGMSLHDWAKTFGRMTRRLKKKKEGK